MNKKKKKYIKAKVVVKKIKLNYFLSDTSWLNQFQFFGTVYACSGCIDGSGDTSGMY